MRPDLCGAAVWVCPLDARWSGAFTLLAHHGLSCGLALRHDWARLRLVSGVSTRLLAGTTHSHPTCPARGTEATGLSRTASSVT